LLYKFLSQATQGAPLAPSHGVNARSGVLIDYTLADQIVHYHKNNTRLIKINGNNITNYYEDVERTLSHSGKELIDEIGYVTFFDTLN
jgi:hypothetical protein